MAKTTSLGKLIKRARISASLSQRELGEKVGVSQTTVSFWEGNRSEPDDETLALLRKVLGNFDGRGTEHQVDPDESAFGAWLRTARLRARLSVSELADRTGISVPAIYNLESGRSQNPQTRTRKLLAEALGEEVPEDVEEETEREQAIEGLGSLVDFDPYKNEFLPTCPGVYVFYDVSVRPVYVGKAKRIRDRVIDHSNAFWFKRPIVETAAYVEVKDEKLRHQAEQLLIRFMKAMAVLNKQSVER